MFARGDAREKCFIFLQTAYRIEFPRIFVKRNVKLKLKAHYLGKKVSIWWYIGS